MAKSGAKALSRRCAAQASKWNCGSNPLRGTKRREGGSRNQKPTAVNNPTTPKVPNATCQEKLSARMPVSTRPVMPPKALPLTRRPMERPRPLGSISSAR